MQNDSNETEFQGSPPHNAIWRHLIRGMKLRCPLCGNGKLFRAYLKPVERCSACGQKWKHVRADLAPAWASMTISAHITVLIWHFFFWNADIPDWQLSSYLCFIATVICLLSLPPMKGLFMAIVWAKDTSDS